VLEGQVGILRRGVRHKPKPGMMDDARWRAGYGRLAPLGLHFELQAPWAQLGEGGAPRARFSGYHDGAQPQPDFRPVTTLQAGGQR